jgi:hypothetical protein
MICQINSTKRFIVIGLELQSYRLDFRTASETLYLLLSI